MLDTDLRVMQTLIIDRDTRMQEISGSETLVVCGSERGMTSIVAYALYNLGYFIGGRLGTHNHEDLDFRAAIPHPSTQTGELVDGKLPDLIEKRNAAHSRWGFKLPRAVFHVEALSNLLRNPVFVVCVRNPVGVARSVLKYTDTRSFELIDLMAIAQLPFKAIRSITENTNDPVIVVDMDCASRDTHTFLTEFSEILGIHADLSGIETALAEGGYKLSEPRPGTQFMTWDEYCAITKTQQ